ncbi:MAG TPA: hypothetical protein VIH29_06540, partial [Gallionella sp.]
MTGGFLRPYHSGISVFQRLIDVGLICITLWVAHMLYGIGITNHNIVSAILAVSCFYFIAEAKG